jgi:phage terminase large subunit-like protein
VSALALVDQLRQGPPAEVEALLSTWTILDAEALAWEWRPFWARADQIAPAGKWKHWLLIGGRGSGKTESLSRWVIERARAGLGPIRLIAGTLADVRTTMVEGEQSGILALSPPEFMPTWDPSADDGAGLLTWTLPDGRKVYARGFSAERPKRLRGKQSRTDAYDDLAGMGPRAKEVLDMAQFGLRVWGDTRAAYTTTPEDVPVIVHLLEGELAGMVMSRSETDANIGNLSQDFIGTTLAPYAGTELEDQERRGILIRKSKSSPFHGIDFAAAPCRISSVDPAELEEIAIGVDPAEGVGEEHDEWGIVVAGRRRDRHVVTMEDLSDLLDSDDAGARVIGAALTWGARCSGAHVVVVAETNRGEDRVVTVLKAAYYKLAAAAAQEGRAIAALPEVVGVRAKEGKILRASDVRPLFVLGVAHHLAGLAFLEAQALALKPGGPKRRRQDDRIDAEIHALHHLCGLGDGAGPSGPWTPTAAAPSIFGGADPRAPVTASADPRRRHAGRLAGRHVGR